MHVRYPLPTGEVLCIENLEIKLKRFTRAQRAKIITSSDHRYLFNLDNKYMGIVTVTNHGIVGKLGTEREFRPAEGRGLPGSRLDARLRTDPAHWAQSWTPRESR